MQIFKKYAFLPAVLFFAFTLVLFTLPGNSLPKAKIFDLLYFDKWVHVSLFGVLCFLFSHPILQFPYNDSKKRNWFLIITINGVIYGISVEFIQKYWTINRGFELSDIFADLIGCLLALLLSLFLLRKNNKVSV